MIVCENILYEAHHLHNIIVFFCLLSGELSEDMETSSETTSGHLDTTKDSCNLGMKQISDETGMATSIKHIIFSTAYKSYSTEGSMFLFFAHMFI